MGILTLMQYFIDHKWNICLQSHLFVRAIMNGHYILVLRCRYAWLALKNIKPITISMGLFLLSGFLNSCGFMIGKMWVCQPYQMEGCHLWGIYEVKTQGTFSFLVSCNSSEIKFFIGFHCFPLCVICWIEILQKRKRKRTSKIILCFLIDANSKR